MAPYKHFKNEKPNCAHKEFHRNLLESLFPHRFTAHLGTCRQSMSFLDSSIFETSHAEKLVQYIRQKRGINNAQRIFNDSPGNEVVERSFPIEIQPAEEKAKEINSLKPSSKEDNHIPTCSNSRIPQVSLRKLSAQRESIGRRILIKEFEKASADEENFQPAAFSTPNSVVINGDPNISGISRITAICQEEEIPETQEPNEVPQTANNVDDYFEQITQDNQEVIPDAGKHYSVDLPANVHQQEETLKNNNEAQEVNDSATLINNEDGRKEECCLKVRAESNSSALHFNEALKSSIGNNLSLPSQKANTSKVEVRVLRSKRICALTKKPSYHSALSPRLSLNEDDRPVDQEDVLEKPSNSNTCLESVDDCKNLKENQNLKSIHTGKLSTMFERKSGQVKSLNHFNNSSPRTISNENVKQIVCRPVSEGPSKIMDQASSNGKHNLRKSDIKTHDLVRSARIPSTEQIEQTGQHIALGGSSNSDSGSDDYENPVSEEDFKRNKNSKNKSTNQTSNINVNSRKSKVKPPNCSTTSIQRITYDWSNSNSSSEEDIRNLKENQNPKRIRGRTSSRVDPTSRRSKAKPRSRLLRKVLLSPNKETEPHQQIASEDPSDYKKDFTKSKEKEIPRRTTGHSSRIEQNSEKSREVSKNERDKPLVYIPITQNFYKKTEDECGKYDKEKIAANDCEIVTNKVSMTKDVACQRDAVELITSDEEEGEYITDQVLSRGQHNATTKNRTIFLRKSNNNSNNPIDLRTRRSNQEKSCTLGRQRDTSNEKNKRFGGYQLGTKAEVHPSDQLIADIMLPLEKGVVRRKMSAIDCEIYTEEEVTSNDASVQQSTKEVQEGRFQMDRADSCGIETGALHCSLESSSANTVHNSNDKVLTVDLMEKNDIAMNKVSNRHNQQNIPVVRKGKKRFSQMDPIKKNYLDISNKLRKTPLENINFSRRKLYSKGDSDNEISQSPNITAKLLQETPVISQSKEETRKTLNFSRNSRNIKTSNKNEERLESTCRGLGYWNNEKEFTDAPVTTSTVEAIDKNDNVFKKPAKPSSPTKRKTGKRKQKNIAKSNSNTSIEESNSLISVEEKHQFRVTPHVKALEPKILKESTQNECDSSHLSVEPVETGDHRIEPVAISRTNAEESSNYRVGEDIDERRKTRLSDIPEITNSSMVKSNDQTKVNDAKQSKKNKEKELHGSLVNSKNNPMTSLQPTPEESNELIRRSSRQRKSPIVYWSCRLQVFGSGEEVKRNISEEKNKKKKVKALPAVKKSKTEIKQSSKTKSGSTHSKKEIKGDSHSKKELKGDKNKENLENKYFEKLKNTVPQKSDTTDRIATNETRIAYELFDRLKESFSTEKSKKRKNPNPKTCEENALNKITKLSEKSSTKIPENRENPTKVLNQEPAPISSDDGISTSEENHHSKPPWCMTSLRTSTTDSGMQTGITSNTQTSREDRLFLWLKNLSTPRTLTSNKDIVQILHSNTIKIANVEDLMFQEINGVEYAYYLGEENNYGYMKFHPNSEKPHARAKTVELKFLSLVGSLRMEIDKASYTIKNGDLVTVPKGVRYGISNPTNDSAILFFIRTS